MTELPEPLKYRELDVDYDILCRTEYKIYLEPWPARIVRIYNLDGSLVMRLEIDYGMRQMLENMSKYGVHDESV